MSTSRFDLVHIVRILSRRSRFILTVTAIAVVLGLIFHFLRPDKYEAKAEFFVNNPLFGDRSNVFAGADSRYTDYFGGEDDIDRIMALAKSDTFYMQVIRATGLDTAWKFDLNDPYQAYELKEDFKDNFEIRRTAYTIVELYFHDKNAARAQRVVEAALKALESSFQAVYLSTKLNTFNSLERKTREMDSTIAVLTDTLTRMRQESGIYDIISPTRSNQILGNNIKGNGNNTGYYVEAIQNIEAEKDMLVIDRARYLSLMHQYLTGTGTDEMPLFHVVTAPKIPVEHWGPSLFVILATCFFVGLFFSAAWALLSTYYQEASANRD